MHAHEPARRQLAVHPLRPAPGDGYLVSRPPRERAYRTEQITRRNNRLLHEWISLHEMLMPIPRLP